MNFTKFVKFVKIRRNSFYKVFKFAQHQLQPLKTISLQSICNLLDYTEATDEWELQWAVEDCDSELEKTVKLQEIRRLCNKLLMIMLNC